MGILVKQAQRVVNTMEQMSPGEKKLLKLEGYVLAQGLISAFVPGALVDTESSLRFEDFNFEWDNTLAQRNIDSQIALIITRLVKDDDSQSDSQI